jgi:hypothetical protein
MRKRRVIEAALMAAIASAALLAPLALGDGGKAMAGTLLTGRHGG